ncbi:Cell division cycle 20.2, cofactor of APC complex [Trichinella pseudospiralis]|uniref:Cell division cycle 20.2, cofactor of APC complex n=1 Tax=Trichinella pseudospiralis TaxID=6337 RepID=A0A0V0XZ94_TRIPS|nr:Cell division cycle 20.2, cofactor of APC complex [Trichinella pseudospiralis]
MNSFNISCASSNNSSSRSLRSVHSNSSNSKSSVSLKQKVQLFPLRKGRREQQLNADRFISTVDHFPCSSYVESDEQKKEFIPRHVDELEYSRAVRNTALTPNRQLKKPTVTVGLNEEEKAPRTLNFNKKQSGCKFSSLSIADLFPSPYKVKSFRKLSISCPRKFEIAHVLDDFYLNYLDWGKNNFIALGVRGEVVFLKGTSDRSQLVYYSGSFPLGVTSVKWSSINEEQLAVGMSSGDLQLYDLEKESVLIGFEKMYGSVCCSAWNDNILTCGDNHGYIFNFDKRAAARCVLRVHGHSGLVCGLSWSDDKRRLASGGNDDTVRIWSLAKTSGAENAVTEYHDHCSAVKALAWCPFNSVLLASGGGIKDATLRIWNVYSGEQVKRVNTKSQVSGIVWQRNHSELISSHGNAENDLKIWNYPDMNIIKAVPAHSNRILCMVSSPCEHFIATVSADNMLKMWEFFDE